MREVLLHTILKLLHIKNITKEKTGRLGKLSIQQGHRQQLIFYLYVITFMHISKKTTMIAGDKNEQRTLIGEIVQPQ